MPLFWYFTCDVLRPCNFDAFASPKAWESRVKWCFKKQSIRENSGSLWQWTVEFFQNIWQWANLSLLREPLLCSGSIVASFSKCLILGEYITPFILNILMLWIVCCPRTPGKCKSHLLADWQRVAGLLPKLGKLRLKQGGGGGEQQGGGGGEESRWCRFYLLVQV